MADGSADDMRAASVRGDRMVKKFLESREVAADAAKRMKINKKKRLWAKQEFLGFGPKMSDERATASAQARQIAQMRVDAKKKYQNLKTRFKKSVAWRLSALKTERDSADRMMRSLQKQLKAQTAHYGDKLLAMKYKLKAEVSLRTSCKAVLSQISLARKKCQCGQLAEWGALLRKDQNAVQVVALGAENRAYKREVERCKLAYRKQGLVYAVPLKNGTLASYASSGVVPSVEYNSTSAPHRVNPRKPSQPQAEF